MTSTSSKCFNRFFLLFEVEKLQSIDLLKRVIVTLLNILGLWIHQCFYQKTVLKRFDSIPFNAIFWCIGDCAILIKRRFRLSVSLFLLRLQALLCDMNLVYGNNLHPFLYKLSPISPLQLLRNIFVPDLILLNSSNNFFCWNFNP